MDMFIIHFLHVFIFLALQTLLLVEVRTLENAPAACFYQLSVFEIAQVQKVLQH